MASAELFTVDSNQDESKSVAGAECETAAETCTLRAAIEAANVNSSSYDVIDLDSPPFEGPGGASSQVHLLSALPAMEGPGTITGHSVVGQYPVPTAEIVAAGATAPVLVVKSDQVTVEHVAFAGGKYGIEVSAGSTGFKAEGNWFGLNLDGTAAAIQEAGIVLRPGADDAVIGKGNAEARNVFTNAKYGVDIEGASGATVEGNYLGVGPSGQTGGKLGKGVWVTDAASSPAKETTIGGERVSATGTANCEGACNVIVASGVGIDLTGDKNKSLGSATGPTQIGGNYIGLAADGSQFARLSGSFGIFALPPANGTGSEPGPGHLTVGGSKPSEGNVIDNGEAGLISGGVEGLVARGNLVGWLPASGSAGSDPEEVGFVVGGEGVTNRPEVLESRMYLGANAVGIESFGPGAKIVANKIYGSRTGVRTAADDSGIGNQVVGNLVEKPNLYGVLIENDDNVVTGNSIIGAGRSGVELDREEAPEPWPTSNRIGGDSPSQENLIEGSGENAISVGGEPTTLNEVLGNYGLANGGPFIKLREHSTGHPPNGEIKPPVLGVVRQSSASGTAKPGAKVRLFGKPSTDPGSLERQIGSAIADAGGHWAATFTTKLAVGKLVAATQTTAAGTPQGATSEVSAPLAAEADPIPPEEPQGGGGSGSGSSSSGSSNTTPAPTPVAPGPKAPRVKITEGPKKISSATKVTFKFKAEPAAGAKFECKLDGAGWAACRSPKTYKDLEPGKHSFRVRAKANGLTGLVAKSQFTVNP